MFVSVADKAQPTQTSGCLILLVR